ncbi:MAG: teichuronic acid exporter [Patiriisocius sp.]|jgi:teichuronic acid exporter
MSSLKQKTISGLLWSFIDNFSKLGLTFVIGIILARLLDPREFGLIGMITIFIALSQSLVDSGFTQALIRKKDCTQADYSTVFYFNLFIGIILYTVLFFSAGAISRFFDEPQLLLIVQVVGLSIIVNAFTIVQRARLTKAINFKLQTKISIIASLSSGVIGIMMAYSGYGVWSLVFKTLLGFTITSFLLWIWNKWKPSFEFSRNSFKEMFSFGYKLLISGLIDTAYQNIYLLVIGKYFSAAELGFYTRADQFSNLPSKNITSVIQRVSYPVLAEIQHDIPRLKTAYQKIIKSTMLITFVSMIILAAVAKPLVLTLVGEKWLPSVIYLQLLSFGGMLYPLHAVNLNMLNVQGRSDLFLRLEIIKKILAIPVIVVGVLLGIKAMIVGMIIISMIAFFLNSYYSGQHIGYSSMQQLKDILPSFILAIFIGSITHLIGAFLILPNYLILIIQLIAGGGFFILITELFKMQDYLFVKEIFLDKVLKR